MKSNKNRSILSILIITCFLNINGLFAQNNTLYNLNSIPQSTFINPAFQHDSKVFLGLPVISSIQFGFTNTGFAFNDLIHYGEGLYQDSLITDIKNFASGLSEKNHISFHPDINILTIGFAQNDMYFSFNVSDRINTKFSFSKDFVNILLNGNSSYLGETASMGGLGLDLNYYREFGFGFSKIINENISFGGRVKLLFGKMNLSTEKMELDLFTNVDTYDLDISSDIIINTSGIPVTIYNNRNGVIDSLSFGDDNYDVMSTIFNKGNSGLGLDLGINYILNEKISFSASLIDLGYINWNNYIHNFNLSGDFEFQGINVSDMFSNIGSENEEGSNDFLKEFTDSISHLFEITENNTVYKSNLAAKLYIGGRYDINEIIGIGVLSRTYFSDGSIYPSLTISANANLGRTLTAGLSYSMMNRTYNNFGLGLGLKLGPFQFYLLNDNLSSIFMPHKAKNIDFRFGLNLLFGRSSKTE